MADEKPKTPTEATLRFFGYDHLPEPLKSASEPFHKLAQHIVNTVPDNRERLNALRKLLEAKDCAVRASIYRD